MKQVLDSKNYKDLLQDIKNRIHKAQYEALKAVNRELIALYWDIGSLIVGRQKKHGWGRSIVENIAKDLHIEFAGTRGFSVQNLWRMRQFYLAYEGNGKLSPLVREIGWSHNIIILIILIRDTSQFSYPEIPDSWDLEAPNWHLKL